VLRIEQLMSPDDATLRPLMIAAQAGDRTAYRTALELCDGLLRRALRQRVHESALDDLVQETLLTVHRKLSSWDPERPFLPWLLAIARYRWVDHLRRFYRAAEDELPESLALESDEISLMSRFGLDQLLARLPVAQSEAIRLTRIEGLSVAEASIRLGQSESLVKVNVHRGLKRLAAAVDED
jgi:RNA polymerase sigma factor (sigma-70 family)